MKRVLEAGEVNEEDDDGGEGEGKEVQEDVLEPLKKKVEASSWPEPITLKCTFYSTYGILW